MNAFFFNLQYIRRRSLTIQSRINYYEWLPNLISSSCGGNLIVNLNGLFEVVETRALWRFVDMFQAKPRPVRRCACV